ncbi:MAG: cellulase family glycosylhydrolase, partial [Gemmataceae bacterium]
MVRVTSLLALALYAPVISAADPPRVVVSRDGKSFVRSPGGEPFRPWGFNYDHDPAGRLIEDYWADEWDRVERDFKSMAGLGANAVRVHLQFGRFMTDAETPDARNLERLGKLLDLAARERLYLNLTGLGCYHKADVPAWYDGLDEAERWAAQARFWTAVAGRCKGRSVVFCYDLMNEPVVPGGRRAAGDWLGPAFGGKHFVQVVSLDQKQRPRPDIARAWTKQLSAAVRAADPEALVTVGLVDWSLDRPGLTSGFVPARVAPDLDFVSVHLYPEAGKLDDALKTLAGFDVGKPVVVEETFPLRCSPAELGRFVERAGPRAAGWFGFYWGQPPAELRRSREIKDALTLGW